jgi:hypothetical protein
MDIRLFQQATINNMVVPEEPLDEKYIDQLSVVIKTHVVNYARQNPTSHRTWWADYLKTGLKKPSPEELQEVTKRLKKMFVNMKITYELVAAKRITRWRRIAFEW